MADAYRVLIVPTARRALKRLPEHPQEQIRRAIRVLYEIRDRELVVLVVRIGHRRDVYR